METYLIFHPTRKQRFTQMRIYSTIAFALIFFQGLFSQMVQYPSTGVITVQRWEGGGVPPGWAPPVATTNQSIQSIRTHEKDDKSRYESKSEKYVDPDQWINDSNSSNPFVRVNQGSIVSVAKEFVANNLSFGTPSDPSMAISDSGFIVTVDNYTVEYYDDSPDTLLQHQKHQNFLNDTLAGQFIFDPRVFYDRYSQRFFVAIPANRDSTDNFIYLSVSKGQDPRNGWYHYRIDSDTLSENAWLDFIMVGANKNEFFISGNMYRDSADLFIGCKIFQIRKREIVQGQPFVHRVWNNVLDFDGNRGYSLCPLSDGMMNDTYSTEMFFASTDKVFTFVTSQDLNWFKITDTLAGAGIAIEAHETDAEIPYSNPFAARQLGSAQSISISDCKVQSGFHLNGVLNFVYCKNTNTYSTIVLNRLNTFTNSNKRYPWGFSQQSWDYVYPSIAFWGSDTSDADNILLCFQRTSENAYPEMAVVNFDSGFAPASTVVKQGLGFIDIVADPNDQERWGDYTTIQRKYNSIPKSCWMIGSYPFGSNPNFWGTVDGLNSYVAQVEDSVGLSFPKPASESNHLWVYPNPTDQAFWIEVLNPKLNPKSCQIIDALGKEVLAFDWPGGSTARVSCTGLPSGVYLCKLNCGSNKLIYEKVLVR